MSTRKKITLKSTDGETFEVDEEVAIQSHTIKLMIEDDESNDIVLPLPHMNGKTLALVVEYCKHKAGEKKDDGAPATGKVDKLIKKWRDMECMEADPATGNADDDEVEKWEAEFVKIDEDSLFELIIASEFLEIDSLTDLACKAMADIIKKMTIDEVRALFHVKNDFTAEEEEKVRNEYEFEDGKESEHEEYGSCSFVM